jgi:hypothetical protein
MSNGSKILFAIMVSVLLLSVSATYYKYFILNDYVTYYDDYNESEEDSADEGVMEINYE